jgi:hypothetical protein
MTERRDRICCSKALASGGKRPGAGEPEGDMAAMARARRKMEVAAVQFTKSVSFRT